jgi:pimeloyl-ACP methyl ester carboxylesterase
MPLLILALFLTDLLSIAFVGLDIYLWREWYEYRDTIEDEYARRCLYGAIALLAVAFLGKSILPRLLGKSRSGEVAPHSFESNQSEKLKRPDGTILHLQYFGKEEAPPIIFVHGWGVNAREWFYQKAYFEKDYRVILYDLAGLGKSTRPDNKDFSLTKMAADLNAVIQHTKAQNPILWGHSIGGMIILTLLGKHAATLTQPIKGIILEHTTYLNPVNTTIFDKLMRAIEKPIIVPLCYLMIALSPIMWLSRWMSYFNGSTHLSSRLTSFAGTQTYQQLDFISYLGTLASPAVTARGTLAMFKYDVTKVPALVIAADKDRVTKPIASAVIDQSLPDAQLVMVGPGGHQGLLERHQEVNEAAAQFIQSLPSKATEMTMPNPTIAMQ